MLSVLFVDLDDTLFQSRRKSPEDSELLPMAYLKDGSAISYASEGQLAALRLFQEQMMTVPVTARNLDAYGRVDIRFVHGAVLNYGGLILDPDGLPDQEWLERSREKANTVAVDLESARHIVQRASDVAQLELSVRIISDLGIPFYVVAKSPKGDVAAVDRAARDVSTELAGLEGAQFRIHQNGNNLAIIPSWLDKKHAVDHMRQRLVARHGPIITFGMGDSLVDLNFMASCHYMIVPRKSQIADQRLQGLA